MYFNVKILDQNLHHIYRNCFASISVNTEMIESKYEIKIPLVVNRINFDHKADCLPKEEAYFELRMFLNDVKQQITLNPLLPISQLYEKKRYKKNSMIHLPDYADVKGQFKKIRGKVRRYG